MSNKTSIEEWPVGTIGDSNTYIWTFKGVWKYKVRYILWTEFGEEEGRKITGGEPLL